MAGAYFKLYLAVVIIPPLQEEVRWGWGLYEKLKRNKKTINGMVALWNVAPLYCLACRGRSD